MLFGDKEIILLNYHNRGLSTIISNQLKLYFFAGVTGRNTSVTEQNKGNFTFSAEIVNEVS